MAILNSEGTLQLTTIVNDVFLIRNPGQDDEEVIFKYPMDDRVATFKTLREVLDNETLSDEEKTQANFWMGYFYAHGRWQLP